MNKTPIGSLLLAAALGLGAAAQAQEQSLKVGYGIAEDHPLGQGVNRFIELLAQKTGGKLKAKGYPATTLGSEVQMLSATRGGVQEMTIVSSAPVVGIQKEFALFDLPFLFGNERQADAVLDGPVGRGLLDRLTDKNLIGLCYWENGFRNVTTSKRPITKLDDIKGLKLRVMQNPVYIDAFNTLGANAVPMPFTELYTALETRAIDAQENPYGIIAANKINEVQKYLSVTQHAYSPFVVLVSKKFWDKLPPAQQQAMSASCTEAGAYERKLNRELNTKIVAELRGKGLLINEIAPDELAKIRAALKPVVDKYAAQLGPELVKQTYEEIDKVSRQK